MSLNGDLKAQISHMSRMVSNEALLASLTIRWWTGISKGLNNFELPRYTASRARLLLWLPILLTFASEEARSRGGTTGQGRTLVYEMVSQRQYFKVGLEVVHSMKSFIKSETRVTLKA